MIGTAGVIDNVFTEQDLKNIVKYMSNSPVTDRVTICTYASVSDILAKWFDKNVFSKITALEVGATAKLNWGAYMDEVIPWPLHVDRLVAGDKSYMTFIVPISVDNNMADVEKSATFVFNEHHYIDRYYDRGDDSSFFIKEPEFKKQYDPNLMSLADQHLSHIEKNKLEYLSLCKNLTWKLGSLLYFKAGLIHCSNNFLAQNARSKQALVIQTYQD